MIISSITIKRFLTPISMAILLIFLEGCTDKQATLSEFAFSGATMGTSYHITVVGEPIDAKRRSVISTRVDSFLTGFNHILSTYQDYSEISKFNANQTVNPIPVSQEFLHVVKTGKMFCTETDGAFDMTVMPIVNFFGFGFEPGENRFPTVDEIDAWLLLTGCDKIELGDSSLTKSDPRVSIDLSAVAKGDASDHVVEYIGEMGYENIFVEIGGEIKTRGTNRYGKPWRVGIDRPTLGGVPGADLQHIIELTDMAVASSGDYRNYGEVEGKRISHVIDPRSGSPISHKLAAVTIITEKCLIADGIATSVMVLGPEEGLDWVEAYPNVEGLLIIRESDGSFIEYMTSGFEQYLVE